VLQVTVHDDDLVSFGLTHAISDGAGQAAPILSALAVIDADVELGTSGIIIRASKAAWTVRLVLAIINKEDLDRAASQGVVHTLKPTAKTLACSFKTAQRLSLNG